MTVAFFEIHGKQAQLKIGLWQATILIYQLINKEWAFDGLLLIDFSCEMLILSMGVAAIL
ncbi:hypothetical protein [Pseudobutyrivibrio xylanivorans]|uniref:Uncharacterized protein n=1 Tax=Pseudobutyrivibrio xylanivorans TaxID=185007 RepID=A0A5P6VW49_PSEXY|nr:hypothetical protein [Pseudobutyrivibrio xylanivorans]QFJ55951.1 hypothetical protein FXF36_14155 [Pseudobutyrivibrio xylanivorans]